MDKLKKLHHSLADWDYPPNSGWRLYDTQYHSPPTSLTAITGYTNKTWIYLKEALAKCVPDGRINTWLWPYNKPASQMRYHFRVQALPANDAEDPANCYKAVCNPTIYRLYKRVNNVDTMLVDLVGHTEIPAQQWSQNRLTWWQYIKADFQSVLRIVYEINVTGTWEVISTYDHTENLWSGSAVNRVGFYYPDRSSPYEQFLDDTEVWKKL